MKNYLLALFVFLGAIAPCFAAETSEPAKTAEVATNSVSPKDAWLNFLLEKAKTYSGTIEQQMSKAVDFAKDETPIVIKEFLIWRAWKHGFSFFAWIPFLITFLILGRITFKNSTFNYDGPQNTSAFFYIVCWIGFIACLIGTILNLDNLLSFIQIQVAPRVYLLEEAMKLIKH